MLQQIEVPEDRGARAARRDAGSRSSRVDRRAIPRDPRTAGPRDRRWGVIQELLFSLEHASDDVRLETLEILGELLPHLARTGFLDVTRRSLLALERLARQSDGAPVDALLDRLSRSEELVGQTIDGVADGSLVASIPGLAAFLESLRPSVLVPLLGRCARLGALGAALRGIGAGIITRDPDGFADLMARESDPDLKCAALGVVGEHRVRGAEEGVARLLRDPASRVRRAAVGASLLLRNEALLRGLIPLLDDPDPNVRTEVARGLGALRFRPAARRLAAIAGSGRLRRAEMAEKRVVFDACGRMGTSEGVDALARVLNGRRLLLWREAPETRASAALALGRARTGAARSALIQAREAQDPTVRRAVRRALARMMRGRTH